MLPVSLLYTTFQHQAVEFWREAGIPLNKMILGLASYGRSMLMDGANLHTPGDSYSGRVPKGAPYTKAPGMYAYYEVPIRLLLAWHFQ